MLRHEQVTLGQIGSTPLIGDSATLEFAAFTQQVDNFPGLLRVIVRAAEGIHGRGGLHPAIEEHVGSSLNCSRRGLLCKGNDLVMFGWSMFASLEEPLPPRSFCPKPCGSLLRLLFHHSGNLLASG